MLLVPLGRLPALVLDGAKGSHHKWRDAICSRDWTCHVPLMRAWINKWHHGNCLLGGELNKGCRKDYIKSNHRLIILRGLSFQFFPWILFRILQFFGWGRLVTVKTPIFWMLGRLGFAKLRFAVNRFGTWWFPEHETWGLPRHGNHFINDTII